MFDAGVTGTTTVVIQGSPFPEPDLSEEQVKDWDLFGELLETKLGWSKEAVFEHFDYVTRHKGYNTPDEWLGEDGAQFRKRCGTGEPSDTFKGWWRELKAAKGNG
jgi:hypothetical protein